MDKKVSNADTSNWSVKELERLINLDPLPGKAREYCYAGQLRNGEFVLAYRYPGQPVNAYAIYYALKEYPFVMNTLINPGVTGAILNYQGMLSSMATGTGGWVISDG
jgi:hypothetical protein